MNEVKITYETLFDLLKIEKDRDELQELDDTFYSDVMHYLTQKQSLINQEGTQSGLFGASESEKTKIQVLNIKKIVKELYERREAKIIRLAINKSKTGSNLTNTVAMLPEEKIFFAEILLVLNKNRLTVLQKILFFNNGLNQQPKPVQTTPIVEEEPNLEPPKEAIAELKKEEESVKPVPPAEKEMATGDEIKTEPQTEETPKVESIKTQEPKDEYDIKIKVKFLGEVPKFVGKKLEVYGPYTEGDTAELPKIIANILINKQRAKIEE
ncbi:hypothetical protein H8D36_01795 [archaeon]|nr:hypothetical protein [archaeon]MBL7057411.1 hypothetical protein [Candidatus Woesearchaeota archaeon]